MRTKSINHKGSAGILVKDIRHQTRKRHSTEEKIRMGMTGLRGEDTIAKVNFWDTEGLFSTQTTTD